MVHLTRIYTKFGDQGECMLGDGSTVSKTSARVGAYGAVDEANAAVGLAVCEAEAFGTPAMHAMAEELRGVQQDLFDVGADLCTPIVPEEQPGERLRVVASQTDRLEAMIDRHNAGLAALRSFVLPGGTRLAAALHLARTTARRAEREAVALMNAEPDATNRAALIYLNRLSDLLFVLSRVANDHGKGDVLWTPGANRGTA